MNPLLDNFTSSLFANAPKLLAQSKPTGKPATGLAEPAQENPMQQILQMLQQRMGQPQQGGGMDFAALAKLIQPVDALGTVARHNAGSNLPSYAAGSTGPWSGENPLFKPMDQAFGRAPQQQAAVAPPLMAASANPQPGFQFQPPRRKSLF